MDRYNSSSALHRLDANGVVDADHRSAEAIAGLKATKVSVLPVAEVANLALAESARAVRSPGAAVRR